MNNTTLVSPKGELLYPILFTPSTKFKPEGEYTTKLILEPSPETEKFCEKLQSLFDEAVEAAKKENKGKKVKTADLPFRPIS